LFTRQYELGCKVSDATPCTGRFTFSSGTSLCCNSQIGYLPSIFRGRI
jgi:hypothetical protein